MSDSGDVGAVPVPGSELQLLVGAGAGAPEELLLIERPRTDGRVHTRGWDGRAWSATPVSRDRDAAELLAELERAVRAGRSLNHELPVVRRWLRGEPDAAPR